MAIKRKAVPPPRPLPFKGPLNSHPTPRPFAPIFQHYQFPTQQQQQQQQRSRASPSDDEVSPLNSPKQDRYQSSAIPSYVNTIEVIDLWVAQVKQEKQEDRHWNASILEPHILDISSDPSRGRVRGSPNPSEGGRWPIESGPTAETGIMGEHIVHGQLPASLRVGTPESQGSSFDSSQDEWTQVSPQRGPSPQRDASPHPTSRNNPFQRSRSSSRQDQDRKPLVSPLGEEAFGDRERTSIVSPLEEQSFSNAFSQSMQPQTSLLDEQDFSGALGHSTQPALLPFNEHSSANAWAEQPVSPPPPSRAAGWPRRACTRTA